MKNYYDLEKRKTIDLTIDYCDLDTWNSSNSRYSALGYKTIEEFEILNNNKKLAA